MENLYIVYYEALLPEQVSDAISDEVTMDEALAAVNEEIVRFSNAVLLDDHPDNPTIDYFLPQDGVGPDDFRGKVATLEALTPSDDGDELSFRINENYRYIICRIA